MSHIERPCPHHEPKKDSSLGQTNQTLMWEPQLQLFASGKLCSKGNQPSLSRPILKVKELVAQWCPTLCNPMDLLSMEFSRDLLGLEAACVPFTPSLPSKNVGPDHRTTPPPERSHTAHSHQHKVPLRITSAHQKPGNH
ncbi:unnamed protein product [Rangifer tarandus platyrhynchus]|uniref:Uncharacterized protein n=1 Tax=Rangifer tarandus platyrhynchus TaxID=3082113 RepID=A0ABN8Z8A4_RANTA|nr:unnamed protein product [Rangifer tarandus platyrhynchus]